MFGQQLTDGQSINSETYTRFFVQGAKSSFLGPISSDLQRDSITLLMGIIERKEREREARKNAILDSAEAIFKSKGFSNATMDDIARAAELAKGTVYLYYKSKEELQVGLVLRAFEILRSTLEMKLDPMDNPFDKLRGICSAYWEFSTEHSFYFQMMNSQDLPQRTGQVTPEMLAALHERSSSIWAWMIQIIEDCKEEGYVKPEVHSFALAMLIWMDGTSVLRFQHKVQGLPDSIWRDRKDFNFCEIDFYKMYQLNSSLLLAHILTPKGAAIFGEIEWPTNLQMPQAPCVPPLQENFNLAPFASDVVVPAALEPRL